MRLGIYNIVFWEREREEEKTELEIQHTQRTQSTVMQLCEKPGNLCTFLCNKCSQVHKLLEEEGEEEEEEEEGEEKEKNPCSPMSFKVRCQICLVIHDFFVCQIRHELKLKSP